MKLTQSTVRKDNTIIWRLRRPFADNPRRNDDGVSLANAIGTLSGGSVDVEIDGNAVLVTMPPLAPGAYDFVGRVDATVGEATETVETSFHFDVR